jgi:hypothetical protein
MSEKCTPSQEKKPEPEKDERVFEIKNEVIHSLDAIRQTGLFSDDFLNKLTLVIFGKERNHKFENGEIVEVPRDQFDKMDFMQGRRIDFVGIDPKDEFEEFMKNALKDKRVLELIFLDGPLSYDEFIAHEIAHNLFDKYYIQKVGNYEETGDVTDVSDDYREKIREIIIPLVKKHCPNIEIEKFLFKRQQIAEIFAMLYEREFCRRSNTNLEVHNEVEENVSKFFGNPDKMLAEFNKKFKSNHTIDTLYVENHSLSIIIAPLLEKEYPGWEERMNIFWK